MPYLQGNVNSTLSSSHPREESSICGMQLVGPEHAAVETPGG